MHSALMSEVANAFAAALPASFLLLQHNDDASPFVACGCLGFLGLIIVGVIALNIALPIWVARDAKSRGMDNAVVWMILVMLTGIIGLIIYIFTRPQGNLVPCPQCANKRLQVSAKCPRCGNS
jgi:hypothetical protein